MWNRFPICSSIRRQATLGPRRTTEGRHSFIWNLKTSKKEVVFEGHEKLVNRVAVRSDSKVVLSIGNDGAVKLWPVPWKQ